MNSLSCIELSKKNLIHNIKQFKNLAKKGTKFLWRLKATLMAMGKTLSQKFSNHMWIIFRWTTLKAGVVASDKQEKNFSIWVCAKD